VRFNIYTAAVRTLVSASVTRLFAMAIWFSMSCICTSQQRQANDADAAPDTLIADKTPLSKD